MKKQMMRVVSATLHSKFFKVAALVVILSGSSYAHAQVSQVSSTIENGGANPKNVVINHIGTANGMLLFEVKVDNASGEKFRVVVKDDEGTTLFQDAYDDKNFAKKFMVPRPEGNRITFIVKSATSNNAETFVINSNTRVVEDVVVTRI